MKTGYGSRAEPRADVVVQEKAADEKSFDRASLTSRQPPGEENVNRYG